MRILIVSNSVKRKIKAFIKKHPDLHLKLERVLSTLLENPTSSKFGAHKLTGKLKNLHAASITYDHRLVFFFDNKNLYIVYIGSHDEVY